MISFLSESHRRDGNVIKINPTLPEDLSNNEDASSESSAVERLLALICAQPEIMKSLPESDRGRVNLYAPKGKNIALFYELKTNTLLFWDYDGESGGGVWELDDDRHGRPGSQRSQRLLRLIRSGMTAKEIERTLVVQARKKLLFSRDFDLLWKSLFTDHFFK